MKEEAERSRERERERERERDDSEVGQFLILNLQLAAMN